MTITAPHDTYCRALDIAGEVEVTGGPAHSDLVNFCSYLQPGTLDDSIANQAELYALSDCFKRMLESEMRSERLSAAEDLLRAQSLSGLAQVVLAREGAKTAAEIEGYYQQAVLLLKAECARHEKLLNEEFDSSSGAIESWACEPILLNSFLWEIVVAEQVRFLWQQGKLEESMTIALQLLSEIDDFDAEVSPLAISQLFQLGRDQDALSWLTRNPSSDAEWHYMNALLLFRRDGNTAVSRGALEEAIAAEQLYAEEILGDRLPVCDDLRRYEFSKDATPAWEASQGALDWLDNNFNMQYPLMNLALLTSETDAEEADRSRFKRWKDLFEHSNKCLDQGDLAQAKRLLKSALREAEKFGPKSIVFKKTLIQLAYMFNKFSASKDDLLTLLRLQGLHLRAIAASDTSPAALVELADLAQKYAKEGLGTEAVDTLSWVVTQYESLLRQGNEFVDLFALQYYLHKLALYLEVCGRSAEAESCLRQVIEFQSTYLGENHPDLLPALKHLIANLKIQGKHREAKLVKATIAQIQAASTGAMYDPFDEDEDDDAIINDGDNQRCDMCGGFHSDEATMKDAFASVRKTLEEASD